MSPPVADPVGLAERLAKLRLARTAGSGLTVEVPGLDVDAAYAVQAAGVRLDDGRMLRAGEVVLAADPSVVRRMTADLPGGGPGNLIPSRAAVLDLAARYHHDDGRPHRLLVAAHPLPEESP